MKMKDKASYHCDSCGEEIVLPIDPTSTLKTGNVGNERTVEHLKRI